MLIDLALGLAFLALLALSAFFSATETAFTAVNEAAILAGGSGEKEPGRVARVRHLLRDRGQIIAAMLIGNNIVNTTLPVLALVLCENALRAIPAIPAWSTPMVATALTIPTLIVFGEVVPKSVAVVFSRSWVLRASSPVSWLIWAFSPIIRALNRLSRGLLQALGRTPATTDGRPMREFFSMMHLIRETGAIDEVEAKLIRRASVLNDHLIREIMVPRQEVVMLPASATIDEIRHICRQEMYSRYPIFGESRDTIVGLLHIKQVLVHDPDRPGAAKRAGDLLQPPWFVPETTPIGTVMDEMRKGGGHLAVVVDEFGTVSGIVTLEDVLEFLVGAIRDEFDPSAATAPGGEAGVVTLGPGRFEIPGRMSVVSFERRFDREFSESDCGGAVTMAGLFLHHFASMPKEGEAIVVADLCLTVRKMAFRRIERMELLFLSQGHQGGEA